MEIPKSISKFYGSLITSYGNCYIYTHINTNGIMNHELVQEIYVKHNSTTKGTEWIIFSVSEQKKEQKSFTKQNNNLDPIHCTQHHTVKEKRP